LDDRIQDHALLYTFQWLKRKSHLMHIVWGYGLCRAATEIVRSYWALGAYAWAQACRGLLAPKKDVRAGKLYDQTRDGFEQGISAWSCLDRFWRRFLRKLINKHVSKKIQAHTGNTNEIKAGTPTVIVLQTRSDVWRYAIGLLVACFNTLPQRWDALRLLPRNVRGRWDLVLS
jgi:hypothetical protein